jgi:hypothetical protein
MWPEDYIEWARRARPLALAGVRNGLALHLSGSPGWSAEEIARLAEQAVRYAFDVANDRRRYREYFHNETEFRLWLTTIALREALRLLLRRPSVEHRLDRLSADLRRVLGMVYLDQLPPGDIAPVFRLSPEEVRGREREALEALFRLLREPNDEAEG